MKNTVRLAQGDPWTIAHNSVMFDGKLSMAARLLWLAYRSHAWAGNTVFPSRKRLAEMVGCSMRTLDRANDELQEKGLIERQSRWSESGGQSTNEVVICVPTESAPSVKNSTGESKFDAPPVSNLTPLNIIREIDIVDIQRLPIHKGLPSDVDDVEQKDVPKRQALYRAYNTTRHICGGERFPLSTLDRHRPELDFLIDAGYGEDDVRRATKAALSRYSDVSRVTFRSVVNHLQSLLEEPSAKQGERKSKSERVADAEKAGYERAVRLASEGDQNAFMMLSDEHRLRLFAIVDDDVAMRLVEGLPDHDVQALYDYRNQSHGTALTALA